jgi:very-short-patch-repair endonuclease
MAPLKKHIRTFSRHMRSNPTRSEKLLWKKLQGLNRQGHRFRRQVPIGDYIVDFANHSAKLIIEVDGQTHSTEREIASDQIRNKFLQSHGFTILRFWNDEIFKDSHAVLQKIEALITPPTPNPSPPRGWEISEASSPSPLWGGTKGGGLENA